MVRKKPDYQSKSEQAQKQVEKCGHNWQCTHHSALLQFHVKKLPLPLVVEEHCTYLLS
jgi:hypothetical protein